MPSEFEIIDSYFAPSAKQAQGVVLGVGDDCALVEPPVGQHLAISIDTLVEGVHFLPDIDAEDLAWRLLGSSVSDLAAMGAQPLWLTLAITLPEADERWLSRFTSGLDAALEAYKISLVGGDTTSGQLRVLSAQVQGSVPVGEALRRDGAQVGDLIYVSGTLGDSRAGLELLQNPQSHAQQADYLLQRFLRPSPRIDLGMALRGIATAAIDISDGLLADLGHLLRRSGVAGQIELESLPRSTALHSFCDAAQAMRWAATGGEDFELCFTCPESRKSDIEAISAQLGLRLSAIGRVSVGSELEVKSQGQSWLNPHGAGFEHFGAQQ